VVPGHAATDEGQAVATLGKRFEYVNATLARHPYVTGTAFTIADCYLYTLLGWTKFLKVDLSAWPALVAYMERIGARPSVQEARRAESGGKGVTNASPMTERLPTLFLSHGSPMTAVEPGAAGAAWSALARQIPAPRAILVVSAHWETDLPMLTGSAAPETIHDFGGFPDVLYTAALPGAGCPGGGRGNRRDAESRGITAGIDGCRGLDTAPGCRCCTCIPPPACRRCSCRCSRRGARATTSHWARRSRTCPRGASWSSARATRRTTCATG